MPCGQCPGHGQRCGAPWGGHGRHTRTHRMSVYLLNTYCIIFIYVLTSRPLGGLCLTWCQDSKATAAVGAAGSGHDAPLKRGFFSSSPQHCCCRCGSSQPPCTPRRWGPSAFLRHTPGVSSSPDPAVCVSGGGTGEQAQRPWLGCGKGRRPGQGLPRSPPGPLPWRLGCFPVDAL